VENGSNDQEPEKRRMEKERWGKPAQKIMDDDVDAIFIPDSHIESIPGFPILVG